MAKRTKAKPTTEVSTAAAPGVATDPTGSSSSSGSSGSSGDRTHRIAELAYLRAEQRGFAPGGEVDDWLTAERELDSPSRS